MRVLITGVDDRGRSCVVEERTPSADSYETGISVALAASTASCPPPPRPPGHGALVAVSAKPGLARWSFVGFPPRAATPFHHTDSVDFDVVLEGSVDLILDDGAHRLAAGDAVVMNGVDHGWQTHDEACRMSVVVIGTPPRER
jgi:quercetin dioxygenase-like cupin family protein